MAPMKRAAGAGGAVKSRVAQVKKAIELAEEYPQRVRQMLSHTVSSTIGVPKADRQAFSERFVAMIEELLQSAQVQHQKDVESKEAAFAALSPAKETREGDLERAKGVAAEKNEALEKARTAVTEIAVTLKEAAAELVNAQKAQKSGDAELEVAAGKKADLQNAQADSLTPLIDGTADGAEDKAGKVKAVLNIGKTFHFESSLLRTAEQVLDRTKAERGAFDGTCLEQLTEAFAGAIAKFDEELTAGAPGKAERASAVEQAEARKQAAETSQADLKEKAAKAKEEKAAADSAGKAANKSLTEFVPELKASGDALDSAKKELQSFVDGPLHAFNELKEFKEDDFKPKRTYYQKINGVNCDREVIDACRTAVAGVGDGRVSVDDAKVVYEKLADGGRVTRAERWTLRYCLQEFHWTEAAHDWIINELKNVPQEDARPAKKARTDGKGYYEVVDGMKCDRGIIDACREAMGGQGDGRVSGEDAQKVWEQAADGGKVTDVERWTLRYCLSEFNWTRAGHDFLLEQFNK